MVKVVLNDKEVAFEFGLKAMMLYEGIAEKPFGSEKSVTASIVTLYACLVAANERFMSFAEFVGVVQNAEELAKLNAALDEELARWNSINQATSEEQKKRAKKA